MVAQGSLEAFVMVRIHVGQPNLCERAGATGISKHFHSHLVEP
jgi:hypothetical protein